MTQDDMPAPAVVDEVEAVAVEVEAVAVEESAVIEYVPPSPAAPSPKLAKPAQPIRAAAPDAYAVGVRVLKMAPAWLLFTAVCCSVLILLLGWARSSTTEAEALPAKHNDARAAKRDTAAAKAETGAPVTASLTTSSGPRTTAANDAPAPAPAQAAAPAPTPQPAPAAPKVDEKARVETPAPVAEGAGKFTAQVGSFNSQSEANERVSSLRAAGFEAHVAAAELPGRGTWYRVQVGRFADKGDAAKAVAALRAKGAATTALVVPVQK